MSVKKAAERMMLLPFFVADTTNEAKAVYGERVEWFYSKVTNNQNMGAGPTEVIKGYELTMTESRKTAAAGYLNFDKLHAHGAAIADDPETCADKLNTLRERLGITEFVLWFNIGGMPLEQSMGAMELAMNEVIPRVNAADGEKASAG